MKIEFTLTKRDKKLLAVLAVCGALFCFYRFGCLPLTGQIESLQLQREALELEQLQMQMKLASFPVNRETAEKQQQELEEWKNYFLSRQENEEWNRYLTGIFVEEGMTMQDSTLRRGQTDEIGPYSLSRRMELLNKSERNTEEEGEEAVKEVWKDTQYVYTAAATYAAVGTKQQALAVLDRLTGETGIRVVSFSISDVSLQNGEQGADRLQPGKRLEVSLAIYMVQGGRENGE